MSSTALLPLSKACTAEDLEHPELLRLMEEVLPGASERRHRKLWEFAMAVHALQRAEVLTEDAEGLSVAAGHEALLYYLTHHCKRLFATDLYGGMDWDVGEGTATMLTDPDVFAPYAYRRRRLVVCHMDALDLRFEDASMDFVISLGSIEHFGGVPAAATSLGEMARVVKPGGLIFITTELAVGRDDMVAMPNTMLFSAESLRALVADRPELEWFGEEALDPPPLSDSPVDFVEAGAVGQSALDLEPHLQVRLEPLTFTSVSLALRRTT